MLASHTQFTVLVTPANMQLYENRKLPFHSRETVEEEHGTTQDNPELAGRVGLTWMESRLFSTLQAAL